MGNYRNRPKGDYIQNANWKELYVLTENWKNDLEFYLQDLTFQVSLINSHFSKLLIHENLKDLFELQNDLLQLQDQCNNILKRIQIHLTQIVNIFDDPYLYNTYVFRTHHEQFEDEISDFVDTTKVIRRTVFNTTKAVLENETPKHSWKYN